MPNLFKITTGFYSPYSKSYQMFYVKNVNVDHHQITQFAKTTNTAIFSISLTVEPVLSVSFNVLHCFACKNMFFYFYLLTHML